MSEYTNEELISLLTHRKTYLIQPDKDEVTLTSEIVDAIITALQEKEKYAPSVERKRDSLWLSALATSLDIGQIEDVVTEFSRLRDD